MSTETVTVTPQSLREFSHVFAEPGKHNIIDVVHPTTGRGGYSGETLEEIRARYPKAEVVRYSDWVNGRAAEQDRPIAWCQCSEALYNRMLNVLTPEQMGGGGFLLGEPHDHHALTGEGRFDAFCVRGRTYYAASRPMTVKEFKEQMATFKRP